MAGIVFAMFLYYLWFC